ncbi:MAG: LamG domain-containing protein [Planctomycetaceae bacterium]|nr:LamG domain-containing protein [Planctomycetaceae bacterium]
MFRLCVVIASVFFCILPLWAEDKPIGYWKLDTDINDHSSTQSKARSEQIEFSKDSDIAAAQFGGVNSEIVIDDSPLSKIGTSDFSLSLWVKASEETDDLVGDLISQYDPVTRRGFNLTIKTNSGVTSSQSNYRQLQFGIDNGQLEPEWTDHGQVGNAVFIYSMATYGGKLYAGTCETGVDGVGHLYRWEGDQQWYDCGAPDNSNAVSALAEFNGELYVATSKYRLRGSALEDSPNENWGGKVFRYTQNGEWMSCGSLPDAEAINGLVVYKDKLYASSTYSPGGLFRYEGDSEWTNCGLPEGKRVESLTVFNGYLYATGYDEGAIYRYDGSEWKKVGLLPDATQTYGFAVYEGALYVSEWPNARIYRYAGEDNWKLVGRLGEELESMPLAVYNGKMYCGSLPLASVYRYDGEQNWTDLGRVDLTPDVKYRRAWSMSVHQGRLFVGTIPSGRIWSRTAGACATHDRTFPPGWHHVAAIRAGDQLKLYLDGEQIASSAQFQPENYDLSTEQPLRIGNGQHDHFHGQLREVQMFNRALSADEIQKLSHP